MRVLHTHWQPPPEPDKSGRLLLWAETAATPPPRRRGRLHTKQAKPHPFVETSGQLKQLLADLLPPDTGLWSTGKADLWLPTGNFGPQPSPQLSHDWAVEISPPAGLAPWTVSGLRVGPVEAVSLLLGLADSERLPAGVRLGTDTQFWQTVVRLGLELLAQQKIVPTLAQAGNQFHARWLPVLDGPEDASRLAWLQQAMPVLCRAETSRPDEAPSGRVLLDTFLNAMIDALARQWGTAEIADRGEPALAWVQSLFSADPVTAGSASQLRHLQRSHRLWVRNLQAAGDKHFRIAFRLEAPQQQKQPQARDWQLHFLLQARDDPSLLVPARQVWQSKGEILKSLDRHFERPQEKLLTGLGYAARLFHPLRAGLKQAKPTGLSLTATEAFSFLREAAPLLETSGFGVLVPPWWNQAGRRLGVRLKVSSGNGAGSQDTGQGHMTFSQMVHYDWELAVGDTGLTREEFEALVALKSPLVQIRGQWVQLDPEQIEAAIQFWEQQRWDERGSLTDLLQKRAGGEVNGLPLLDISFEERLSNLLDQITGEQQLKRLPPPEQLQATLRPYQAYGYSWLDFLCRWGLGACLADDMGLGKTIQTLAFLQHQREQQGRLPGPTLLVCPTSVVTNWERESSRFAPRLKTMTHQGGDRLKGETFIERAGQTDLVLTSYALVRRDIDFLQEIGWYGVVLDEAQNIKNPETKQSRAVRSLQAEIRIALTGTPIENRLSELWSIMSFLNPGYLGSRAAFRRELARPIEREGDEEAAARLKALIEPLILRRVKTDPTVINDLPDKVERKVYCHLSEEQGTLYEAVVQEAIQAVEEADGIQRKGLVLSMMMKLKQICNHPAQFLHQVGESYRPELAEERDRSGKLLRLTGLLEEALAVGDRALIFTQFTEMGELLKRYLQNRLGVSILFLHGGTPAKKRTVMVNRFQEEANSPPIFILSLKAGGTGLNLTRANHVFHFDRWWNPAVEDQATDRAFRIGQHRNVQVHKFVCEGTLEERIDDMIESKKALAERIVGQGENWLTELSTTDLKALVALRKERYQ